MKPKLSGLLATFLLFSLTAYTQPPSGYYDPATGLSGTALKQALHNIIRNHTVISYTPGVWQAFYTTDRKPDNTVWDIYSDIPGGTPPYVYQMGSDQCGNASQEGDCYSREHSWPKSWFGGEVTPMFTDLFILYPVDQYVNGRRSDYPYGEVGQAEWTSLNGSKLGNAVNPGYSDKVFEPRDEYKGDLARTYFYFSVRYYGEDAGWPGSPMANGSQLTTWALDLMKDWHRNDPVSTKEINRNNAVYAIQNNRNPFIDHPEYAAAIWGGSSGIDNPAETTAELKPWPNPAASSCTLTLPTGTISNRVIISVSTATGMKIPVGIDITNNTLQMNLEALPPGLYFFTITTEKNPVVYHGKVIRQ